MNERDFNKLSEDAIIYRVQMTKDFTFMITEENKNTFKNHRYINAKVNFNVWNTTTGYRQFFCTGDLLEQRKAEFVNLYIDEHKKKIKEISKLVKKGEKLIRELRHDYK